MLEQPEVLASNAPRYLDELRSALADESFDMVLLAARGTSDHAALYAKYLVEIHLGIPVSLAAPSVITKYGTKMRYPKCLAVGISQSGAAPDVSEVIAHLRAQGHVTLAITNTAGSRLAQEAEHTLVLETGPEKAVAATKTYTASLLAIYQLVRSLRGDLPEPELPDDGWMEKSRSEAEAALGPILRCSPLFSLARGYSFCSAFETALKLMECSLLPCRAYSTADFEHGPKALATEGTAAIVFGEVPASLADHGCVPVAAPVCSSAPSAPLCDVVFGQWLALLAARARGIDPDTPQIITKVTRTL